MSRSGRREGGSGNGGTPVGEPSVETAVVRRLYAMLEEGGVPNFPFDARVVWVDPFVSRLPFDGVRHGVPALLRAAFRRSGDGAGPRVEAEAFLGLGDGVLVSGRLVWPRRDCEESFLHECSVRDGAVYLVRGYPT